MSSIYFFMEMSILFLLVRLSITVNKLSMETSGLNDTEFLKSAENQ